MNNRRQRRLRERTLNDDGKEKSVLMCFVNATLFAQGKISAVNFLKLTPIVFVNRKEKEEEEE
ncbi:hypothetical protein T4E_8431 [Trichinella pseudospiralis]|uniref:Uncharacterized protein n=1 Tax=Trichinella pseudospiralis TaxID=6337 RepID=A0A0V0YGB5_TRIPS|nr:hypothetical protein T4E_8431 [Trichinella pseudospiralis]